MKSIINFLRNIFSSGEEHGLKIETMDSITDPETMESCGCDDCQCGKKTYIIPVGERTPEEAKKSLEETIASYKEEVIILPDTGVIKIESKVEENKEVKDKKPRKPYKKKDSSKDKKGKDKGKNKNSETSQK